MKTKIPKGKPLDELAKGSLSYTMERIRSAFRKQFRGTEESYWYWYIVEIFADHVIVQDDELPPDEFYRVPFSGSDSAGYTFAARDAWEVVELAYQPQTVAERLSVPQDAAALVETLRSPQVHLAEAEAGKPRRLIARGMTADIVNSNGRRYPARVLKAAVAEARLLATQGSLLGESVHPTDKLAQQADILETLVRWDQIRFEGGEVLLEGTIIETAKGRDLITLLDAGVLPRLSQRAYGYARQIEEGGATVTEITELHITGYDLVMDPGDPTAQILAVESRTPPPASAPHTPKGVPTPMDKLTLEQLREQFPDLVAQIIAESDARRKAELEAELQRRADESAREQKIIREREAQLRQQLGLSDTDDLAEAIRRNAAEVQRLQEAEQARQVAEYIAKECGELKYPANLKAKFTEAVQKAAPKTIDEAKALIAAKKEEYGALMADIELQLKGFGGVRGVGPVLEREAGGYALVSAALTESLVLSGLRPQRDLRQPRTPSERFAAQYLEAYDARHRHHLLREAQAYQEAGQTADLNLPYSVMRAVMAEALPILVAASVFDFGMTNEASTRVYFERFVGESGSTGTVTNEAVTADHDTWVNLAQKRIIPGATVVVTNNTGATTYDLGDDYVIDHVNGRFKALSTGAITDGQALLIDYTYDAIRKGEMQPIERAKMQTVFMTLEAAADRLAAQISREAIVFSRAQIGYDVVGRTLSRLIESIARKVDRHLFTLALMSALQVANNAGGSWTAASDSLDDLVKKVGVARVKLMNRYYTPTAIVVSATNSDRIANWDGFTALGARPDADLNAMGFVGRLKALPVFETTEFPDSHLLVVNREVVFHRVFQPAELRGPYPTYDVSSGELIAADQYYVEEFNASDISLQEKASYVNIV